MMFFDLLSTNGQEESKSFLLKPPALWSDDATFQEMSAKVKLMKVVNDTAERGIYPYPELQQRTDKGWDSETVFVAAGSRHRKQFQAPTKDSIMKANNDMQKRHHNSIIDNFDQ